MAGYFYDQTEYGSRDIAKNGTEVNWTERELV